MASRLERAVVAVTHDGTWLPWLVAAGVVLGGTLALAAVRAVVHRRLLRVAPLSQSRVDDLLADLAGRTSVAFLLALTTLAALAVVSLPERVERIARDVATIICLIQAGVWGSRGVRDLIERRFEAAVPTSSRGEHQAVVRMATLVIRLALWAFLTLVALDNLGVNVTALVTGLGVGGVAIALATQNILGDIFASVSILIDKPFVLGDFISVDDYLGTVEQIGIKTTRVRALSGEQIIFSNSDLLKSRLRNYKSLRERRVVFRLNVAYETTTEKVQALPGLLREIVEGREPKRERVRFDRAHLAAFGESALVFEVVYFVLAGDYAVFMDTQQAIHLQLHGELSARGIALAYPTRTLHVVRE
jgi:small-conductance mechanosensitive channel